MSVTFAPMSAAAFEVWRAAHLETSAHNRVDRLGLDLDVAREAARLEMDRTLPAGVSTPGMVIREVHDSSGRTVGAVWIGPHPQRPEIAFVYDIVIDEEFRGRGFGRATMIEAERFAGQIGFREIGLSVSGGNAPARQLYDSLGYQTAWLGMRKPITP